MTVALLLGWAFGAIAFAWVFWDTGLHGAAERTFAVSIVLLWPLAIVLVLVDCVRDLVGARR